MGIWSRACCTALVALLSAPVAATAVSHQVSIYLDLNDDPSTGCLVNTVEGPFAGVEQVLISTVETTSPPPAGVVTDVALADCLDPETDTFGSPVSFDGGWPVGIDDGLGARDVVETYVPLLSLVIQNPSKVRLAVVVTDGGGGEKALLTVDGTRTGAPIVLDLRSTLEIPTLSEGGALLLALLLALLALRRLRRRDTVAFLLLLCLLGVSGAVWAARVLDGQTDDWVGADQLAADGIVLFGKEAGGQLCFRVDEDLAFNQPPTITAIADQTIPEDGSTGALAFTVGDAESPVASLTVTAESSNQVLVPDANLALGGAGANRTVTVTPAADQNGVTEVTVTVEDPDGGSASTTFQVTVTSSNDPPTISAIGDQTILEDGTTGALPFTVGDVETPAGSLTVTASSDDQAIVPDANLVLGGAAANRTITATPAADQNGGPVTVTVTVHDTNGGSVPEQFTVTVTPVNDAPSFTLVGNVTSDEDAGAQSVPNQATSISPGPADEAGQTVGFLVSNDNNALFNAQPAIDASGTLTYTSAPDASGMATVTVQAMDDGGTADGGVDTSAAQMFTITVNPVNDPPTAVGEVFDVAAGNFDPAIGNTTLQFADTDTVTEPHVFVSGDVLANDSDSDGPAALSITAFDATGTSGGTVSMNTTTGEFTYVPPLGFEGTDTFDYTITDGADPAMATVTIEVTEMVWYLDNQTDGTGDDGRSGSPFDTIAQLEAVNGGGNADDPEAGDIIFVHEGTGTYDAGVGDLGGIDLLDQQKLWGEGIGLTVSSKTLVPAGNRPVIDNTNSGGDGVTVLANTANGDRTGIEIRGLSISGDDNVVAVSSADAAVVGVTISDNLIDDAGGDGLDLNPGSSGDFTVSVSGNTWSTTSPTGNGFDLTTGAGNSADVLLALDGNTDITGGAAGIKVDGSAGTGTVYVTSLSGNSVNGATAAGGMVFDTVVFDADPSDANFTGDAVDGGATTVGSGADRVSGSGVVLDTVAGDLSFSSLTVFNSGGTGLRVIGTGSFNAGAGTGFRIGGTTGTIDTLDGPAIDIDPTTSGLTLASVTSQTTSGTTSYGIHLDAVDGTFQVSGATSISATGGTLTRGILAEGSSASITFTGQTTVTTTSISGIALTNLTGPFTVSSSASTINGAAGAALDIDQGTGNVTYNGSITNTAGRSVEITNHGGPGGGSIVALAGAITDTGTGIFLDNNDQGAGGTVINLTGALILTTGGSNAFTATNGGTVNVTDPTNNNLAATTTGTGVIITDTQIGSSGAKFTTVNVGDAIAAAPNAANGVLLTSAGAGTFTVTGGAIQNVTSRGLDVSGGTGNVSFGASISTTSAGRSLEVTGHTGGTVAVSGALDDNGLGVNLDSNTGGTVTITGGMDIDTVGANTGFNATGGGTVNVMTGVNDVDTSAGTGVAVNIVNTTIGVSDVRFRSVSANGAASGIVLNATGTSGGLVVTGDGTNANNASGGTIQNTTDHGIVATDTQDLSLTSIRIQSPGNAASEHGILATGLRGTNLLRGSTITGFNQASGDGFRVVNNSVNLTELRVNNSTFSTSDGNDGLAVFAQGSSVMSVIVENNSLFTDLEGDAIDIIAGDGGGSTGTVNLTVQNSSFTNAGATGNGGIQARAGNAGTLTGTISNNTFNDTHRLASTAGVIEIQGNDTGSVDLTVSGNDLDTFNQSGIDVVADDASDVTAVLSGNFIDTNQNDRIGIRGSIRNTGATRLTIQGNQIGQTTALPGTAGTRSPIDIEVFSDTGETNDVRILIDNNQLRANKSSSTSEVMDIFVDDNADVSLTVTNNTLTNVASGDGAEITTDEGTLAGTTLCLDLRANAAVNPGPSTGDIELIEIAGTYSVRSLATVVADNPGANIVFDPNMAAFSNAASCLTP